MREPIGELTIEPDPLPERVLDDYDHLLTAELATVSPYASGTTLRLADVALVHLYADYNTLPAKTVYGINATVADDIAASYKALSAIKRGDLAWEVKHAMARQSALLDVNQDSYEEYYHESRVFMDNQPLFFEPFDHAMLQGFWHGRRQNQLKFEALDIPSQEQRRILLGGFATFLTFLKQ